MLSPEDLRRMEREPRLVDLRLLLAAYRRLSDELREERAVAGKRQRKAEARADALELDQERAHRMLDQVGIPRETREGGGPPVELSLEGRLRLALEDGEG